MEGHAELQQIYLTKVSESLRRTSACEGFLQAYRSSKDLFALEASVLQVRKALECLAFAAIAPNKGAYEKLRLAADEPADYRKDFNARKILQMLTDINPDFYPVALLPPTRQSSGQWHFDRRPSGFLTKKQFESFYDRLGKFLHADNPWGNDKGIRNMASDLPGAIADLRGLLQMHCTFIRTPEFSGTWVVEALADGTAPKIIVGQADRDFVVMAS